MADPDDRTTGPARWVVVDVETTGLARHAYVVEVACEVLDVAGVVVDRYETLVRPPRGQVGATPIHGITAQMIARAPHFADVARRLHDLIVGRVLVGHNLAYDWAVLRAEFARANVYAALHSGGVCTARLARRVLGGRSGLDDVCRALGLSLVDRHRAASDVRATAQVLIALLARLDRPLAVTPCRPFRGATRLPRAVQPLLRPVRVGNGAADVSTMVQETHK